MKSKAIVVVVAVVGLVAVIALVMMARAGGRKAPASTPAVTSAKGAKAPASQKAVAQTAPAKKAISKDMGGLTVKLTGVKKNEMNARGKIFRVIDAKSSVFSGTLAANRLQELPPGNYDIEMDTAPAIIRKNINVRKGGETVEDLSQMVGSIDVKVSGPAGKANPYKVKVVQEKSAVAVASGSSLKPIDIVAGTYDVQIESLPKQIIKGVRVEPGRAAPVDIGSTGSLRVKVVDDAGKEAKVPVRIRKAGGEFVASWTSNKPLDIMPGAYDLEIGAAPADLRKDVRVSAAEETIVEAAAKAAPAPVSAPAAKVTAPTAPVKK